MYRTTFVRGAAAPGGGRGFVADQRSGRHLPASHAINGVVHEENGDFFAAIRSMHDFRRANRSQVAIALIRDNHLVGTSSLDSRGCRGRAAVRCLNIANIKIRVSENRTTHRTDQDGFVLQTQILESFGNQLVNYAVAATGTVMRLMS